jgi:carboxymethylenebutenolidase
MIERVSFTSRTGDPVEAALVEPADEYAVPGVVVIQEWWGLNDQIKSVCARFAAEGFLALAPDLYHGKVTSDRDEASHLVNGLDFAQALREIAGAVDYLHGMPRCNGKVAILGFCMGGAASFAAACTISGLAAVVPFYGVPPHADWSKVQAPIQAHFAQHDDWATPAIGENIKAEVERHGGTMELHVYDAQHAFFNEQRPEVYSPEAASLAWQRALAFLKQHTP